MKRGTRYFLLLSAFLFLLTGCANASRYTRELLELSGLSEENGGIETLTLEKIEEYLQQPQKQAEQEEIFETTFHGMYAYDALNEGEQIWYQDINSMLAVRSDKGVVLSKEGFEKGLSEADIDRIYQAVLIDHPEYFFVEGYEYTIYRAMDKVVGIEIKGTYELTAAECLERRKQIEEAVQEILQDAPINGTDYEKIKYVYEAIIYRTQYRMDAADNQNIYSVFIGQASVCQGYAKATQYLLNYLGVECSLVFGEVNGAEGHAWNLVEAEGEYYYVDTTWGDASYLADEQGMAGLVMPDINYDYLCITTEQLVNTHTITHEFDLPVCDAVKNNYYRMEGGYLEEYDEAVIRRELEEALLTGKNYITLKCSDENVYQRLLFELLEEQRIFDYLDKSQETIAYIENEPQLSLTFWMTN